MRSCRALRRCLRSAASIEPISGHQHSICGSVSRIHHTSSKGCGESVSWFNHLHRLLFSGAHLAGSHTSSRIASSYLAAGVGLLLGALSLQEAASSESERHDSAGFPAPEPGSIPKDAKLDTEGVVQYVKRGIEERLQSSKEEGSQIPKLTIAANGQQVAVRFSCRPTCDMPRVIEHVIGQLGGKDSAGGSDTVPGMVVRAWDSPVLRHVIISTAEQSKSGQTAQEDGSGDFMNRFSVSVFEPLVGDKPPEIEFLKFGYFSAKELDTVASVLKAASQADNSVGNVISPVPPRTGREGYPEGSTEAPNSRDNNWSVDTKWPGDRWRYRSGESLGDMPGDRLPSGQRRPAGRSYLKTLESLERMGVKVYGLETIDGPKSNTETINWDSIAGYQEQKREIEDTVLLALQRPEVYDKIARGTRRKFESNRPRAILFEGPPGTGKTSCARVIASQAKVPLLYVPVESLVSKYYGESEKSLASIFSAGNELPDGAIVFLDEIDSLATARDNEMHEATRRLLSVLLRQMDGFEQTSRVVVIAATNRKQDLDSALLSRFDSAITFNLPDQATRGEIASQYARHLTPSELASLAAASEGMSGRDLHDVCQQAERRWASKLIRGVAECSGLPPIAEYLECANKRQRTIVQFSSDNGFHRGSPLPSWQ